MQHGNLIKVACRRQTFFVTTVALWFLIFVHYLQLFTNHLFKISARIRHRPGAIETARCGML